MVLHKMSRVDAMDNELETARILIQGERLRMITFLQKNKRNISELADETGLDRATVSYHLSILEKNGIVSSDYEMLTAPHSKGKIGRFYRINREKLAKASRALEKLKAQMNP
jgi:DNA-binding transcriptional ArsR family regulator